MDIRAAILKEHTKAQTDKIVAWVGNSQERFDQLFDVFFSGEPPMDQRAAWPLSYCVINHPSLINRHFGSMMKVLDRKKIHDALKRNIFRLMPYVKIPGKYRGPVMDTCFCYISDPQEAAAVKAFALHVLQGLVAEYPEIAGEVKAVIEYRWDNESPAFRSRARKVLKTIDALRI